MEEDKNKTKEKELLLTGTLKLDRRKFLKSLTLVSTGVLAYSSPAISAVKSLTSKATTLSTISKAIDIQLPATYKFSEARNLMGIKVKGQTLKVNFKGNGVVLLSKTKDANIAQVSVQSLTYTSVDKDPLAKAGVDTGTITAFVSKDTIVGTLNLKTGEMKTATVPINVSMGKTKTMTGGTNPGQQQSMTQEGSGDKKNCKIDIDINLGLSKTKSEPAGDVSGVLTFNLKP